MTLSGRCDLHAASAAGEVLVRGRLAARRGAGLADLAGLHRVDNRIHGSILCPNVRVHSFCHIQESILMPACAWAGTRESESDRRSRAAIPRGAMIGFNQEEDRRRHVVSKGVVVVVAPGDEPFVSDIPVDQLQLEAEADRRAEK